MNALQIKIHLLKRGLTISNIARGLELEYDATFDSIRTMLTNMFYHGQYNEKLASLVADKYAIVVDRQRSPRSVKAAVQRAA